MGPAFETQVKALVIESIEFCGNWVHIIDRAFPAVDMPAHQLNLLYKYAGMQHMICSALLHSPLQVKMKTLCQQITRSTTMFLHFTLAFGYHNELNVHVFY